MDVRQTKEGIRYKNGRMRLIEHDLYANSSVSSMDVMGKKHFIDDPLLEIN